MRIQENLKLFINYKYNRFVKQGDLYIKNAIFEISTYFAIYKTKLMIALQYSNLKSKIR